MPNWMRPLTWSTASSTARSTVPRTVQAVSARCSGMSPLASPSAVPVSTRSVTKGPSRVPSGRAPSGAVATVAGPASRATRHSPNRSPWSTRAARSGTTANGRPPVARQQRARHGVGQGAAPRGLAQRGRRGQGLGPVPGVEVLGAQGPQRAGHVLAAGGRVVLGAAGGVDPAEGGERLGGGGPELQGLVGQDGVHRLLPSRSLATIMRWTSMVPDATVAAWA